MDLQEMTAAQRRAVLTDHPNVFTVAGPGSGKTETLAQRIRRLITGGVTPSRICVVTYTNNAARNIEERIGSSPVWTAAGGIELGFSGTLHGFCLRMLRDHGVGAGYGARTAVLDEDGANELLAAKMATTGCKDPLEKVIAIKRLGRPTRLPGQVFTPAKLAILSYMDELAESGLLDFDMILTEFLRILVKEGNVWQQVKDRFDHVLVDEVQDSAAPDWAIYYALPIPNKFFVGDPDQAIFGFRGGNVDLCLKHAAREDVEVITLEENFRCAPEICQAANDLIRHNPGRIQKLTQPADLGCSGQVAVVFSPHANEGQEIATVVEMINDYYTENDGTVAVLARTNAIAAGFRDALEASGTEVAKPPRSTMPIDWGLARALLEFLAQPDNDTLAFFYVLARTINKDGATPLSARKHAAKVRQEAQAQGKTINGLWFNAPKDLTDFAGVAGLYADKEGLTRESVATIAEMARELPPGSTMLDLALEAARRDRPPEASPSDGVTCTTIHSAKGREWDVVYLVGMEDEVLPGKRESVEEARRLFFVGLTRARNSVWITHADSRRAMWGNQPIESRTPSRFIGEALP